MTQTVQPGKAPDTVFIVGCGNIGHRVAAIMHHSGAHILALARSDAAAEALGDAGITPVAGDLDRPETLGQLPTAGTRLFYFAPPPARGAEDTRMAAFLAALPPAALPRKLVYISTSGVYGDRGGAWVDETARPNPQTDRARRRLHAEALLRAWGKSNRVAVVILRVGGIYSHERLPVDKILSRTPLVMESECGYINRIHADDLARICHAAMERGGSDTIYNVSDGHPGTMTQYFLAVADALGLERPPIITMEEARHHLSPAMLTYLKESRRMDNRKMLEQLQITLRYPDLASGLAAARH